MTEDAQAPATGTLERLKLYAARNERRLTLWFFVAGFLFDIVTLGRIDSWLTIGQQVVYLVIVTAVLVHMLADENAASGQPAPDLAAAPVSYTHLTLPTN